MNQAEKKAFQRWRKVPARLREPSAFKPMHQASQRRFEAEKDAITKREAETAHVYDGLRSLIQGAPQLNALQTALNSRPRKPVNPAMPKLTPMPALKSPKLRLDPTQLIDVPPFLTDTWFGESGPNIIEVNADPAGNLSFSIVAGWDGSIGSNHSGSGQATCWAAAGQDYTPPAEGMLVFSAAPSFSWSADWSSHLWRQAAGTIWIGQLVIRFDQNGVIIDAPVSTQDVLYTFNDRNLSDGGDQSGSSSGISLQSQLIVDPAFFYRCFVSIGGSANANPADIVAYSTAHVALNASFSTIVLDLF